MTKHEQRLASTRQSLEQQWGKASSEFEDNVRTNATLMSKGISPYTPTIQSFETFDDAHEYFDEYVDEYDEDDIDNKCEGFIKWCDDNEIQINEEC